MEFTVQVRPSGHRFVAGEGETLLDAALRNRIALPYGCRNGACRSCKARLRSGDVAYPGGPPKALTAADVAGGWILPCRARANADLELEVEEIDSHKRIVVRTLLCRVVAKEQLAHDVVRLSLALPEGERLQFLAGQYVDIILRDGRRRAFSLANAPSSDRLLELHVRHVPGGSFSSYAFSHLKEKALLRLRGPLGSFYLRRQDRGPVILVAGGTGFAPIKSIVEDALGAGWSEPVHLYWGVRNRRDLYADEQARSWAQSRTGFIYHPVLSEPSPQDGWSGRTGFVHQCVLEDFEHLRNCSVYMSGPPVMVDAGRSAFVARGLDPARLHSDAFDYAYETGHDAT